MIHTVTDKPLSHIDLLSPASINILLKHLRALVVALPQCCRATIDYTTKLTYINCVRRVCIHVYKHAS